MEALTRSLFQTLHGVFDKDHGRALALRVRHQGGCRWSVVGDSLELTAGDAAPISFDLSAYTVRTLVDAIEGSGFEVPWSDLDLWDRSSLILLNGAGDQETRNGDHLYAYTSALTSHVDALGRALSHLRGQIDPALQQMILPQSDGGWADLWGSYFGVVRVVGEQDAAYTARIVDEVKRARNNPAAILGNIKRITGFDLEMREPWKEFHVLSQSELSGSDHIQGAPVWQYHTAQMVARSGVDWSRVLPIVEADRPAGTVYLGPATFYPPSHVQGMADDAVPILALDSLRSIRLWLLDGHVLSDNLVLSDTFAILNHPMLVSEFWSKVAGPLDGINQFAPPITICVGELVLSDSDPIGDVNARFAGSIVVELGGPITLSDFGALSDYQHEIETRPVDIWFYEVRDVGVTNTLSSEFLSGSLALIGFSGQRYEGGFWGGLWDARRWRELVGTRQSSVGYVFTETGDPMALSDLGGLSDYDHSLAFAPLS